MENINIGIAAANILLLVAGIFYSIILHEMGHGYAAMKCGDDTAKRMGRITLNPLPHIDMLGTVVLPVFLFVTGMPLFGWAKPVPVNPRQLTHKHGMTIVSVAGVIINFSLAFLMFLAYTLLIKNPIYGAAASQMGQKIIECQVFPCPKVLLTIGGINIMLFIFNMLPFPPLDGYNFLVSILPEKAAVWITRNKNIFMIIFIILLVTGLLRYVYTPIYYLIVKFFDLIIG